MHVLAISLLAILAGTLLLSKYRKEAAGKFFISISWFFIVVGFLLFIGFIAGGICKFKHHGFRHQQGARYEMMENCHGNCPPQMMRRGPRFGHGMMMGRGRGGYPPMMQKGMDCCPEGMMEKGENCCPEGMMGKDRECCPEGMMKKGSECNMKADSACCPGHKKAGPASSSKAAEPAKTKK